MNTKTLDKIKHGHKIINIMPPGVLFFVEDIRRASGLDSRNLKDSLNKLLKNGYLNKNERGQWFIKEDE